MAREKAVKKGTEILDMGMVVHFPYPQEMLNKLSDYIGTRVIKAVEQKAPTESSTAIAKMIAQTALREFCSQHGLEPTHFELRSPDGTEDAENFHEKQEQAVFNERVVAGQIKRIMNCVRRSHYNTLLAVFGDSDKAEEILAEAQSEMMGVYKGAVRVGFRDGRDHAEKILNEHMKGYVDFLENSVEAYMNAEEAEPEHEMHKEAIMRILRGVSDPSELIGKAFEIDLKTNKIRPFNLNFNNLERRGIEYSLKGMTGEQKVHWLIENVPATELGEAFEVFTTGQDVANWLYSNGQKTKH